MENKPVNEKWHEEIQELIREKRMENECLKKVRDSMLQPDNFPEQPESKDETDNQHIHNA